MNADKLIKSPLKTQDKWLGQYDQSTFGGEIADNDIGYFLNDIDELIETYLVDYEYIEQYEVFKNLKPKELKTIKKSSLLTDKEIEELKNTIVEEELMNQCCKYIWYSIRKCEGEKVFAIFTGAIDGPGSVIPSLYGIFKSLEDARKSLIGTGCYVDETQKQYF